MIPRPGSSVASLQHQIDDLKKCLDQAIHDSHAAKSELVAQDNLLEQKVKDLR